MIVKLEELPQVIKDNSSLIGENLGDAGHKIVSFGIEPMPNDNVTVYLLGQDFRSGTPFVKKLLSEHL